MQVSSVKGKIEKSQGSDSFPCSQQLLIHQGKVLKDETTMADNKVSEGGFLVVMLTKVGLLCCCPGAPSELFSMAIWLRSIGFIELVLLGLG